MTFHAYSNSHIGHLQWNDGRNSSVSECDTFFEHLLCCFCPHFDIFFITHSILPVDPPTIRLLGAPQIDVEEGKDSLVLRCEADANPPASIVWKRAGRSEIASLQVSKMLIIFPPFFRRFRCRFHLSMFHELHGLRTIEKPKIQFHRKQQQCQQLKHSQLYNVH